MSSAVDVRTAGAGAAGDVPRGFYAGILLCSVGVLMQEILLTRIFSFTIWYHLAYVTIGTALLGFGAAGSIVAARPGIAQRDPARAAALCAGAAGLTLLLAMALLARHPIDPRRILTQPGSFSIELLAYYAAVTTPFLLAGLAVVIPLAAYPQRVNRLYAADLLGAGLGCAAAVAALSVGDASAGIATCAGLFLLAGACYAPRAAGRISLVAGALLLVAAAPSADRLLDFLPSESKAVGRALRQPGTRMLFTRWSPVNRVDLFQRGSRRKPFWALTGLSKKYDGPIPEVLSIQYDGHNGSNVFRVRDDSTMQMLDAHLLRTPYFLLDAPRVLVIGVGGGIDVLNALRRGASRVTGIDLQPITIELHRTMLSKWTGGQLERPDVELYAAEGRHFVRASRDTYDLIQITAVDTFSAQSTGAYVLAESYLYTVEAFQDYLDHLDGDGVLSLVVGDQLPADPEAAPPLLTRLVMIAREALERRGVADPAAHIAVAVQRNLKLRRRPEDAFAGSVGADLLVKREPFTARELARLRAALEPDGFELFVAPDRRNRPATARLLATPPAELASALDRQPFAVEALSDERPFFYHVQRWRDLLDGSSATGWIFPGSTTGQLMLLLMLAQSLVVGSALILLPLRGLGAGRLSRRESAGFLLYFLALGLGFLLVEISFVQKYVLLLGYPTYSLSVTIFSLLVFAALGALLSQRFWGSPRSFLGALLAVTVGLVVLETLALPPLRERVLAEPLAVRVAVTVLLQLPLGTALGMYFPTGIQLLQSREPRLVPWAWAVNGVGSVVASVLAVVLGMVIGFSGVAFVAASVYCVGTLALLGALRGSSLAP